MVKNKLLTPNVSWKKILLGIYTMSPTKVLASSWDSFNNDEDILACALKIKGDELYYGLLFLRDNGLVKLEKLNSNEEANPILNLTEKGFNVALELENQRSNKNMQFGIAIFTAVLAMSAFIEIYEKYGHNSIYAIGVVCILMFGAALLYWKK